MTLSFPVFAWGTAKELIGNDKVKLTRIVTESAVVLIFASTLLATIFAYKGYTPKESFVGKIEVNDMNGNKNKNTQNEFEEIMNKKNTNIKKVDSNVKRENMKSMNDQTK